jgi:CheY-like chemotaxis protein
MTIRLLHADDEPDIREVVEISLGLDPDFIVLSCASGQDAIAAADSWSPDIILLDVMMPVMDGPTTLSRLRENPNTKDIPVLFMTARVQAQEIEHFCSIGARGVIAKPFDPLTLAASIKYHIQPPRPDLTGPRERFLARARDAAVLLAEEKTAITQNDQLEEALKRLGGLAHKLLGGSGTLGFKEISKRAGDLEEAVAANYPGAAGIAGIAGAIDALSDAITQS